MQLEQLQFRSLVIVSGLLIFLLSACKTMSSTHTSIAVTPVSKVQPVAGDSLVLVHGKVFHPTDSIDGVPGVEISYRSMSADSKLITVITDAKGEYQVRIPSTSQYQITVRKDGKNIEVQEFPLSTGAGKVIKNFYIGYIEPDEDDYRRKMWPSLYFDIHSSRLRPKTRANLDTMAIIMRNQPRLKMLVEGHADPMETPFNQHNKLQYLEHLGQQRALAVTKYLREHGVPANVLDSVSYGGRRPAAPSTQEDRRFNQRVEIKPINVNGVEDGYGLLILKFAELLKAIPNKAANENVQKINKSGNNSAASRKEILLKPGRKVKSAKVH